MAVGGSIGVNLGTFQKGRFTFGNVTLDDAVLFAFDLSSKELLVGLDWSDSASPSRVEHAPGSSQSLESRA